MSDETLEVKALLATFIARIHCLHDISFINDLHYMGFNNDCRKLRIIQTIDSTNVHNISHSLIAKKNSILKCKIA